MKKLLSIVAVAAAVPFLSVASMTPVLAESGSPVSHAEQGRHMIEPGTELGTTAEAVSAALAEKGFIVTGTEEKDGYITAHFTYDGNPGMVDVDTSSGMVTSNEVK